METFMIHGDSDTLPRASSNEVRVSIRLIIKIPIAIFACMEVRSVAEGRSFSNLAAHQVG